MKKETLKFLSQIPDTISHIFTDRKERKIPLSIVKRLSVEWNTLNLQMIETFKTQAPI